MPRLCRDYSPLRRPSNHRTDTEGDDEGLIGILAHKLVGGLGAFDRFLTNPAKNLPAAVQCGREAPAGLCDLIPRHVGGGGHQSARIFGQGAQVVLAGLFMFVHYIVFLLLGLRFGIIVLLRSRSFMRSPFSSS
jgi:hypothetical protein